MKKITTFLFFITIVVGITFLLANAADLVKTNQNLIFLSNVAVSSVQNATVNLYIGDNLSGVTTPVKSAYLVASGVYTGSGTLEFKINGDAATIQTFDLPNVGTTPTSFEFIYKDPSNTMSPTSAGEYSYALTMTPSGVTLYGFAVKLTETHEYVPTSCPDGTTDKAKTNETLVMSLDGAISTLQNGTINLYIGDNLSGVSTPVKSTYLVASGVYTGNGTLAFTIDGDGATTQSFTLPDVGTTPTPFELIYKDPSNKINPISAGEYSYPFSVTPSGITVYGLGIKMVETHQYVPGSCGGLPVSGDLTSSVYDTGVSGGVGYNSIMWKGTVGTGKVKFKIATSDSTSGPWTYAGSDGTSCGGAYWYEIAPNLPQELTICTATLNNKQYYRYQVRICSNTDCVTSGVTSPVVDDVIINWAP
jgi:hypothetical protein